MSLIVSPSKLVLAHQLMAREQLTSWKPQISRENPWIPGLLGHKSVQVRSLCVTVQREVLRPSRNPFSLESL